MVARKIYYNQTTNLLRTFKVNQPTIIFPCALKGEYDLFVQARQRGSIKIEVQSWQSMDSWPLLNRTQRINLRNQNRVRKRQMIVKWDRSKFDFHAVHYCLVISVQRSYTDFCAALEDYVMNNQRRKASNNNNCLTNDPLDIIFNTIPEKAKKINPYMTNIICTGSRTQQLIRGLAINNVYYLDVFGVHTKKQNLTFHLASSSIHFNRTHPLLLKSNTLNIVKISGLHGIQVFSIKVPALSPISALSSISEPAQSVRSLRYLILPCGGSEVDAIILRQRKIIGSERNIYKPTYIKVPKVSEGERYLIRFKPSSDDEILRANKIALAVNFEKVFNQFPELPENITVFEVRTQCRTTEIAWYSAPEKRIMSYCIIVFNLPQRNRNSFDSTNYCLDFGKRIMQHPQFHSIKCPKKKKNPPLLETDIIYNLTPGESYLIYVTANLSEGRALPYQTLQVKMYQHCLGDD